MHHFACQEALCTLARLPERHHSTAFVLSIVARCHFELAEYRQAADVYALCCAHKMHRSLGLEYYSTALWHLKEGVELGYLAQRVLAWNRMSPQVWCAVGNSFSLQKEHEQAIRCFRRAIQLDPSCAYAHTLCGHEFAASDKFETATQLYKAAIALDSRHYNAWWGLGDVYRRQAEHKAAKYHFQRALEINGGNAVLRTSLGMACRSLGEQDLALQLFSPARGQQCALASFYRGCVLAEVGRSEEAIDELRYAQGLAPREPCVQFQLGRVHASVGDAERALLHFTMAMDLCGAKDSKDHHIIVATRAELLKAAGIGGQRGSPMSAGVGPLTPAGATPVGVTPAAPMRPRR